MYSLAKDLVDTRGECVLSPEVTKTLKDISVSVTENGNIDKNKLKNMCSFLGSSGKHAAALSALFVAFNMGTAYSDFMSSPETRIYVNATKATIDKLNLIGDKSYVVANATKRILGKTTYWEGTILSPTMTGGSRLSTVDELKMTEGFNVGRKKKTKTKGVKEDLRRIKSGKDKQAGLSKRELKKQKKLAKKTNKHQDVSDMNQPSTSNPTPLIQSEPSIDTNHIYDEVLMS